MRVFRRVQQGPAVALRRPGFPCYGHQAFAVGRFSLRQGGIFPKPDGRPLPPIRRRRTARESEERQGG
jgi:hypothetical protein